MSESTPRRDRVKRTAVELMSVNTDFPQAPAFQGRPPETRAPFRFAPTFVIDLLMSSFYLVLFFFCWIRAPHTSGVDGVAAFLGAAVALCYLGKVFIIGFLNQRGGDARTYVISSDLVTTGLYAYSRNPTYLLTLVQYVLWSVLLLFLQLVARINPLAFALTLLAPVVFFLVTDRVIITREDAALSAKHPEAFAAYAAQVGRWFGRKNVAR